MISAIVLAAGQATRFGRCKQLMPLGGKTLLEHVLGNLKQSKVDVVVVVLGDHADEIRARVRFDRERVVLNPDFADGMSTSIQAGLRALPASSDAAMIVLADQPFVTSRTLDALVDEYRRTRPSVVIPTYNGFRGNPVIVDRALFAEMMGIQGDVGCRSIFGDHAESIVKVAVDDRGVVTDIDTPEDLDRVVIPSGGGVMPSDSGVNPSSVVRSDSGVMPSDSGVIPSVSGVIPSGSEGSGRAGRDPAESGAAPTQIPRYARNDAGFIPSGSAVIPSGSGVIPSGSGVIPSGSGVIPSVSGVIPSVSEGSGRVGRDPVKSGAAPTQIPRSARNDPDLLETIVDLWRRRQPFAMATIVRAERPTSSKPGDKAIISPDGTLTGWIGGSCAHDIVVRNALQSLEERTPRLLTLSSASPLGVQRQGVIDVPMQCYSGGVLDVFIEPNLPRPQMVVVGYETVARAVVRISKTLQFHVTVVDPLATRASVPEADEVVNELKLAALPLSGESFIVIATHGRYDEEALEQAAKTSASYIALVSSPKRAKVILEQLRERGLPEEAMARIKSPAGLDIGAEGAEEIALSIVAEIVRERRAGKLKKAPATTPRGTEEPSSRGTEEAVDPICQMTVVIADARYTAEHDGRRYYFCCQHCQRTFEKEPQRYAHVA
jgi:xanthine dehydrogenase accessory factor